MFVALFARGQLFAGRAFGNPPRLSRRGNVPRRLPRVRTGKIGRYRRAPARLFRLFFLSARFILRGGRGRSAYEAVFRLRRRSGLAGKKNGKGMSETPALFSFVRFRSRSAFRARISGETAADERGNHVRGKRGRKRGENSHHALLQRAGISRGDSRRRVRSVPRQKRQGRTFCGRRTGRRRKNVRRKKHGEARNASSRSHRRKENRRGTRGRTERFLRGAHPREIRAARGVRQRASADERSVRRYVRGIYPRLRVR